MARRGVNRFKRLDLQRAVKGVREAGLPILRVDVAPDGVISLVVADDRPPSPPAPVPPENLTGLL